MLGAGSGAEPLQPGFVILQSNPLLYTLASWSKQDNDKTDCVSTWLQGDCTWQAAHHG